MKERAEARKTRRKEKKKPKSPKLAEIGLQLRALIPTRSYREDQ